MRFLFFRRSKRLVPIHDAVPPSPTENPVTRHEPNDVNSRALAWVGGGFVIMMAAIFLSVWGVWQGIEHHDSAQRNPLPPPMRVQLAPPSPRLQADVGEDETALRVRQQSNLNSYGWVDRQHGQVRIPINRAIDEMVAGGEKARH